MEVRFRSEARLRGHIGGHGNTTLLEALTPYHGKGKFRVAGVQHEAVAAHAATAPRWAHGIESAVFTSIGPGWLNTLIGQATAMSDGFGYLVFAGDKTTAYEGPNMQQIMRDGQFGFASVAAAVAKQAYTLIDPRNAYTILPEALAKTREKGSGGPVNIFLPMNLQAAPHNYNMGMLLRRVEQPAGGRTSNWGPHRYRLAEWDFRPRDRFGMDANWPIRYQDLESYYGQAERLLGVSGSKGGIRVCRTAITCPR